MGQISFLLLVLLLFKSLNTGPVGSDAETLVGKGFSSTERRDLVRFCQVRSPVVDSCPQKVKSSKLQAWNLIWVTGSQRLGSGVCGENLPSRISQQDQQ